MEFLTFDLPPGDCCVVGGGDVAVVVADVAVVVAVDIVMVGVVNASGNGG